MIVILKHPIYNAKKSKIQTVVNIAGRIINYIRGSIPSFLEKLGL